MSTDPQDNSSVGSWSPEIKSRWRFSAEQNHALEAAYHEQHNPSQETINRLAQELQSPRKTVVTWFQNRRAKERRRRQQRPTSPTMIQAWTPPSPPPCVPAVDPAAPQSSSTTAAVLTDALFPSSHMMMPAYHAEHVSYGDPLYYMSPAASGAAAHPPWPVVQELHVLDDLQLFWDIIGDPYSHQ